MFSGPLDLLLYLIRRDEVDIQDVQIARVTEQYLEYVRLLEQVDPNAAGDFLVLASTLIELKSRALLPSPPLETFDDDDDPRTQLVRQLLEYKRFKDAARALGSAADDRARRFVRQPADLPKELAGLELEEAQVWDLLQAFGKVMTSIGRGPSIHAVDFDDTPIERYASSIVDALKLEGPCTFHSLFAGRATRSEVVGMLLALLELIRNRCIRAEQEREFGTIYLFLLEEVEEFVEDEQPDGDERSPYDAQVDEDSDDTGDDEQDDLPRIVARDESDVHPYAPVKRKQHEQTE